jgi:N-acetylglutamate synthase-like GNAT family acetyltransferase
VLAIQSFTIYPVTLAEIPLIKHFYKRNGVSFKFVHDENIFILRSAEASSVLAVARFLPRTQSHYLLRNVFVDTQWRLQGLARQLIKEALLQLPYPRCYCYVFDHLQGFYQSLGFIILPATQVPEDIARGYEICLRSKKTLLLMGYNH